MQTQIRYDRAFLPLCVPLGLGPNRSEVRIEGETLHIKMGWGFKADIPLSSVTNAKLSNDRVLSRGVHGWRGRWLVNGSSDGMVELTIDPPVRASMTGVGINLHTLYVSVTDPDALIEACTRKA